MVVVVEKAMNVSTSSGAKSMLQNGCDAGVLTLSTRALLI